MNIHLPIDEVDKFVDIAVSKRLDWKVSRRQYKRPERIVYSLKNKETKTASHNVQLYSLDRTHTEIVVTIKESHVLPSPFSVGGIIEVTEGSVEVDEHIKKKPIYIICHAIWSTVKLQEYLRTEDIDVLEKSGDHLPLKPPKDADFEQWFEYKLKCEERGYPIPLKQLARDMAKSYGYVRTEYSRWKRATGKT